MLTCRAGYKEHRVIYQTTGPVPKSTTASLYRASWSNPQHLRTHRRYANSAPDHLDRRGLAKLLRSISLRQASLGKEDEM